jgi:hypothetical protein
MDAVLRAIVAVPYEQRVRCGEPGCGHSVYRRIHVVEEAGELKVLGSTCFAKRYGSAEALGAPGHGGGGGRELTPAERELLLANTRALLAAFEAEARAAEEARERAEAEARAAQEARAKQAAEAARARALPPPPTLPVPPPARRPPWQIPGFSAPRADASPWPWQKPVSSVLYLRLRDGSGWVRVQHGNGAQLLAPWPPQEGWDEALPPAHFRLRAELEAYELPDVGTALAWLRARSVWETKPGRWQDVLRQIQARER